MPWKGGQFLLEGKEDFGQGSKPRAQYFPEEDGAVRSGCSEQLFWRPGPRSGSVSLRECRHILRNKMPLFQILAGLHIT